MSHATQWRQNPGGQKGANLIRNKQASMLSTNKASPVLSDYTRRILSAHSQEKDGDPRLLADRADNQHSIRRAAQSR